MRRVIWIVAAVVVIAVVVGAIVVMRWTSSREHVSLADVQAALVPLSAMPAGTKPVTATEAAKNGCPSAKPPLVEAHANYLEPVGPKTANGLPQEIRTFGESVSVYARGTSAQRMNDIRALSSCGAFRVAALRFPRLATDQVSDQLTVPEPPFPPSRADVIALRVNDSAVLIVSSTGRSGAQTEKATEAFARKAYTRAKSKLGG